MATPLPDGAAGAPGDARRQHGNRAQRAVGRRRGACRPYRGGRRRHRRAAGRLPVRPAARHRGDAGRRRRRAARAGREPRHAVRAAAPTRPHDADVVFHTSASAPGLATAIGAAGMEATVVELSWYGAGTVAAPLGDAFHSRRLKLISSQVGQVSAGRRIRWNYGRRLEAALDLLKDDRLDALHHRGNRLHGCASQATRAAGGLQGTGAGLELWLIGSSATRISNAAFRQAGVKSVAGQSARVAHTASDGPVNCHGRDGIPRRPMPIQPVSQ